MKPRRTVAWGVIVVLVTAWSARGADNKLPEAAQAILDKADQFELLSLDPMREGEKGESGFHSWKVLGKTTVKDAGVRKPILTALNKGISESDGHGAKCFNPRHGIRASYEGKTVDLVICFECLSMKVYLGDAVVTVYTTNSPQAAFDKLLRDANVPLAAKPQK
jgi:hypothetical protein